MQGSSGQNFSETKMRKNISQRAYMKNSWTWIMIRGPIMEAGGRLGGGGAKGEKVGL